MPDTPAPDDLPGAGVVRPRALLLYEQGDLIDRLATRVADEVESAELPLLSGETLRIVCLAEVEQWMRGIAIRLRSGEPL